MRDFTNSPLLEPTGERPHRSSCAIWWLVGGAAGFILLSCGGILGFMVYLGAYGPETSVYTGNRIPSRFLRTIDSVGALDDDETIVYFYSDAMTDIRDGFYFVSSKKVAVYSQQTGDEPLTAIPFEEIEDVDLYRNESFFEDSEITVYLKNGRIVSFPVSSEFDRDQQFYEAIQDRTAERVDGS